MYLIGRSFYILLVFCFHVELTLIKNPFRYFVDNVATVFHKNWRENLLARNPHLKNRFRLTRYGSKYNSSDFIYPMILTVGSCLVHRNLKVARSHSNSSLIYVDILNMNFNELPFDWAKENRASARIACQHVLRAFRRKHVFNQQLIEQVSEIVHIEWMKRNQEYADPKLMVPYANLTEIEKDKDREAFIIACRVYNQHLLYQQFNTTPIHFIGTLNPFI